MCLSSASHFIESFQFDSPQTIEIDLLCHINDVVVLQINDFSP